jgi:hypothetical protein
VRPTVAALRPTVARAGALLHDARPVLLSLAPTMRAVRGLARRGLPLLNGLAPSLRRLRGTILPYLAERDPGTDMTTWEMIGPAFSVLGGGTMGPIDANGHIFRFPLGAGEMTFNSLPCRTFLTNPDATALARCQGLSDALKTFLSYKPLGPVPGTASPSPGGKR